MGLAGPVGLIQGALPLQARSQDGVALQLARRNRDMDVVVTGLGDTARVVTQSGEGSMWTGRLSGGSDAVLSSGSGRMSIPGVGWASIQSASVGSGFELVVKGPLGTTLPAPTISANGDELILRFVGVLADANPRQMSRLDLRRPGRVPQSSYAPQLRPRAVAPPLGDMAIGTMVLQNRSYVNVSGPPVTLSLNNAPAKDALMSLARLGGYGFVFVGGDGAATPAGGDGDKPVTMAFTDQTYGRAINSVLLASGLQAKLDGRTLMVGEMVSGKTFGPQMSKVYRLNQASASSAADYLASLGAQIRKVVVTPSTNFEDEFSEDGSSENGSSEGDSSSQDSGSSGGDDPFIPMLTEVETYGAVSGPLRGLAGTTDSRLQTITLVGDPQLISVAEGYLKQIDLRQRQVAVKVQILNVDLKNDKSIDSSFSARLGNTFIVSENGRAFMNFGAYKPGTQQGTGLLSDGTTYASPGDYSAGLPQVQSQKVFDPPLVEKQKEVVSVVTDPETGAVTTTTTLVPVLKDGQPEYVESSDPAAVASRTLLYDKKGRPIYVKDKDPNKFRYPKNSFYNYLEAAIVSSSAKTLAQPTLLVQEGQEAEVVTGTSVITSVATTDAANGSTQFSYTRENAGLTLKVKVSKIDDNGFVSMNIDPEISVPESIGENNGVAIYNISGRSLKSGSIRLRDRQTLVLTGVIQDQDKEEARKWPILGDLPLIGQLFRSSDSSRVKTELVILVTPAIVEDEMGGSYGYGYRPSTREARQLMGSR